MTFSEVLRDWSCENDTIFPQKKDIRRRQRGLIDRQLFTGDATQREHGAARRGASAKSVPGS